MQLDIRAQTLLKALVERYIADGQPVGSRALAKISGLELSPATIRNIMSDLEELGLVASPHTSAGRIPTPRGYRLFVDSLLTVQTIDESTVESRLQAGVSSQKIIASAAQVLSSLSHFAGVVLAPRREMTFQQIEFLRLSEKRILLVIVAPNGDVQNRLLLTETDYSPNQLVQAANYINQNYSGLSFDEVRVKLNEAAVDYLVEQGFDSKMGARPMARKISDLIKVPLSRKILFEKLTGGTTVIVDYRDGNIEFDMQYSMSITPSIDSNGYIVLDGIKS